MTLKIAVQMDAPESINIKTDTSFALMYQAQQRGYPIWIYQPHHLSYGEGRLCALSQKVHLQTDQEPHIQIKSSQILDLEKEIDVVLMRQDPPFDMHYITAAHLLEMLEGKTLVVNNPFWVRSSPEKLFPLHFKSLMPPTLVSRNLQIITEFRHKHKNLVIKPLYGNGGASVFYIKSSDSNFFTLLDMLFTHSKEPVMLQAFLPEVTKGDKRILFIDGEAIGAINRLPPKGEIRSNMHIGGQAEPSSLTKRDQEICQTLSPFLKKRGLILTGIDVIGDWLTEINVTSPTGITALKQFSGIDGADLFWQAVLRKLSA